MKPFDRKKTYNICEIANNMLGFKHSEETKLRLKNLHSGNTYSLGFKHSEETKLNMSMAHTGLKHSKDVILKLIKINHPKMSENTKNKLKNYNTNKESKNKIVIHQLDAKTNEIIKIWSSLTEASNNLNLKVTSICAACRGRQKTCGGFKWVYSIKPEKLNYDIEIIKSMYKTGNYSTRQLAKIFNISKSTIWSIIK